MSVIYCNIDMFSRDVTFYLNDKPIGRSSVNEITDALPILCYTNNTYDIHLFGNENFVQGIADTIMRTEPSKYNYNKLRIEVN